MVGATKCIAALVVVVTVLAPSTFAAYKNCGQPVDVIFVFDDKSCITLARDVIVHYKSLLVPETKLKVGVAFCAKTEVEHTGPEAGLSHLLMTTENLQHAHLFDLHPRTTHLPDRVGIRAENTPYPVYEVTDISSSKDSCLKTVGTMFDTHGSDKSLKTVILVATQKTWADTRHIQEAAALKGPSYNATLAVIAAGIKSADSFKVLETMASDPSKFMTASSTNDLHDVSNKFSKGACRLHTVDLSTPAFPVTSRPISSPQSLKTCEQLTETAYEVRMHMGPLGYVIETKYCEAEGLFDQESCSCAVRQ